MSRVCSRDAFDDVEVRIFVGAHRVEARQKWRRLISILDDAAHDNARERDDAK